MATSDPNNPITPVLMRSRDAPLRLLVVDDDELDRLAVRRCLQQSGLSATVDQAESAARTLELVAGGTYDCVFLDYYLPDTPGLSLFAKIRDAAPDVPLVMFTGRGDEDIAVELMKAGAADYLPKASMTPERLAAGLRHAIELARASRAQRRADDELRLEESRFRTLANAIPQLAWMSDVSGRRWWYNQRWLDYTGATIEEMQGQGWKRVHHPDHVQRVTEAMRRGFDTGEPWEDIYPLRGKDGTYRWFLSRALPIPNAEGEVFGWLGTKTDVTDQKNAEIERERLLALEQEARSKAERATKSRDELLAIVAHDLRNPLQIIVSAAGKLASSLSDEKRDQYHQFIQRSASEMDRLIRDLLEVASMESGRFTVQRKPVDLRAVLEETRDRFDLQAREGKITVQCEIDAAAGSVRADRGRLSQLVSNLLGNAIKFTPAGGEVSLSAHRRDGDVVIVVGDSGQGIGPDNLPHVFDRFWRGDRASGGGAGLGLTICKGIVEAHGGRIWVESTVGVGTTVHVAIPSQETQAPG